ncbi:MAG TPA: hypothetical protein VMT34_09280, partial [Aggregatilineales bacterium]|nr:hypothetical protein [Aggregatilineales bacterium]
MTNPESEFAMPDAISDFRRARQRALVEDIIARLQRKSNDLLAFEEVRQKLHARAQVSRGLQEIPIDAIVGSVGRYSDFNRHFLPRSDRDQTRWVRVMAVASDLTGFPPIEAYKIGSSYFVLDGNHRVSVVRELGGKTIPAYVTEIETRVPFDPNTSPDELIIKSEYADSLEHTQFDRLYPDVDLSVTVPGQYQLIENHICAQHGLPGGGAEDRGSCTMDEKAVRTWYETTYKPVIAIIRERGMLRDFPDRTETDLYVWIVEHRAALEEELGWEIAQSDAADHLVRESSPQPGRVATRIRERLLDSIRPELFEAEPPLGAWRQERLASVNDDRLFADILVPVNGQEAGWWALAQAIGVARHEGGRLAGLYVVASEADRDSETTRAVRAEFEQRCVAAGVQGKFAVDIGGAAQLIC